MKTPPKPTFFSGLDLGPAHEFTALAIVERIVESAQPALRQYKVRDLHRFECGTPYAEIAAHVARRFAEPPLAQSLLMVDQTMVGQPIVQVFRQVGIKATIKALRITAGQHSGMGECGVWRVPKLELASTMQVLLQSRRLTVASSLKYAQLLLEELANFKLKHPPRSDDLADWREAPHDDLVFAVATAVWKGEREPLSAPMGECVVAGSGCPGIRVPRRGRRW
jgi:hypothetical protein